MTFTYPWDSFSAFLLKCLGSEEHPLLGRLTNVAAAGFEPATLGL